MLDEAEKNSWYVNRYAVTATHFGGFTRLMCVWKGSIIKLIWIDLVMFFILYSILSIIYRHVLLQNEPAGQYFELLCIYCAK